MIVLIEKASSWHIKEGEYSFSMKSNINISVDYSFILANKKKIIINDGSMKKVKKLISDLRSLIYELFLR